MDGAKSHLLGFNISPISPPWEQHKISDYPSPPVIFTAAIMKIQWLQLTNILHSFRPLSVQISFLEDNSRVEMRLGVVISPRVFQLQSVWDLFSQKMIIIPAPPTPGCLAPADEEE